MSTSQSHIILDIKGLTCGYGDKPVLSGFDLQLRTGETLAITGPNGCGKSTLLKAIYQLCKVDKGSIFYNGTDIVGKSSEQVKALGIAWFMQKNSVFTKLTVRENLELALNGFETADKKRKTEEILINFPNLRIWFNKTSGLLSGGQRQQLAMAMLVVQDADLWLLDEPTAGLDKEKTNNFIETISNAQKNQNLTIILIEHKMTIVHKLATQIFKF